MSSLVLLDPGHGGADPGAVAGGVREADLVLSVAEKARHYLLAAGYRVRMTRTGDVAVSLPARLALARELAPAAFVSIHANAAQGAPRATGFEVWVRAPSRRAAVALAAHIRAQLRQETPLPDRGTRAAGFYVLGQGARPAVLVEVGFMTTVEERRYLTSAAGKWALGRAIARGVDAFLGLAG